MTLAKSGRPVSEVTLDALRAGDVDIEDVRIHPQTLEIQAQIAEEHGNPQLAANFRRAAELALLPDSLVMGIYEALRPRRSTREDFEAVAADLEARGAVLNAALVREAAGIYLERGLLR
ncbi:MAG: diol dehydratase small subunit [Actinobacteria bacterium]|nr:diol dehydratase small subunit [Actinomycetota bacterium]